MRLRLPGNCSISTSNLAEGIRSHSSGREVKENNLTAVRFLVFVLWDVFGAALSEMYQVEFSIQMMWL